MNLKNQELWEQLRAAYRPQVPELDTASIMDGIRREAAWHPLRRATPGPIAAIPIWVCAMAASLAILAAATAVGRSITTADRTIGHAWLRSIPPEQLEASILNFTASTREGNEI
jgi:hypothetical protein